MKIKSAVRVLKSGGVVVFPTETSYGIGCDATNAKAVRRVFEMKGRSNKKGTPLIVSSLAMARRYAVFSPTALALAKKHWPGPLTLVLPIGETKLVRLPLAKSVLQDSTVALRVSSDPTARALARGLGRPIIATSANRSGEPPAFRILDLPRFGLSSDDGGRHRETARIYILNAGTLPKRKPSTLARVIGDCVEVLRRGSIKI
ncbi:MAG: L-threonylcarbamoyladenylate synthase [Patescibacteria group bacterium]